MSSFCSAKCRCIFRAWHIVIYILVQQKEISNFTGFHSCISRAANRKKMKEEKDLMKKITGSPQGLFSSHSNLWQSPQSCLWPGFIVMTTAALHNHLPLQWWGCCSILPHIFHIPSHQVTVGLSLFPTPPVFMPSSSLTFWRSLEYGLGKKGRLLHSWAM